VIELDKDVQFLSSQLGRLFAALLLLFRRFLISNSLLQALAVLLQQYDKISLIVLTMSAFGSSSRHLAARATPVLIPAPEAAAEAGPSPEAAAAPAGAGAAAAAAEDVPFSSSNTSPSGGSTSSRSRSHSDNIAFDTAASFSANAAVRTAVIISSALKRDASRPSLTNCAEIGELRDVRSRDVLHGATTHSAFASGADFQRPRRIYDAKDR
jgi:hypothetical protein